MPSSENDLAQRVAYLESYTNTLHMVLDHFVQRIRKVEAITGQDEEGLRQSLEWRASLEASLTKLLMDQNWYWHESEDPIERSLGDVSYKKILKLAEMLPIDVVMSLWARVDIPTDLPLIWSEESPTHEFVAQAIKDQSSKDLSKTLKEIKKYDR